MKAVEIKCKLTKKLELTPTTFELEFACDPQFSFIAGQFISMIIPKAGKKGRDLRRAYSIASSPTESKSIHLCIKRVEGGKGTTYLDAIKLEEITIVFAPYGDFVFETKPERDVYFVATGTGIAPFRSFVRTDGFFATRSAKTYCLLGVRHEIEVLYDDEFNKLKDLDWITCVTRPESDNHFKGRVTDYLRDNAKSINWKNSDFYLCGNGDMITETKTLLSENGVEKEAIFTEKYF